jgi:serine/threonine protein kinase
MIYRFGEFELNTRAAELRKSDIPVRLQEQPFRILLLLLERRGDIVLRTEIQEALWPNGTVVEFGHGINAAVQRLREALLDKAGSPRYIETVARRGYRFIGEIGIIDTKESATHGLVPADDDLIGQTIGHYRVIEKIGAGAMGVVYRATDLRLKRDVALKVLGAGFATDERARQRFEHEARAASALNHPNVCIVYDVEEHRGQPVICMEFLEGETVAAALGSGPIAEECVLKLAAQFADALHAAHSRGIVHGDLKPENLFITATGLKVLDFGLAEIVTDADGDHDNNARGGTPRYMAPEQNQGKAATPRSDLYSFGLVLREMLGEKLDRRWSAVLQRCLATNPDDRWEQAAALRMSIEQIVIAKPRRRYRLWFAAAASFSLIVAAAAGVWKLGWPERSVVVLTRPGPVSQVVSSNDKSPPEALQSTQISNKIRHYKRIDISAPGGLRINRLTLSPDGSKLAYVAGGMLFVRPLDGSESETLLGTDHPGTPFWSPDGSSVAFVSSGQLKKVRTTNSIPETLAHVKTNIAGAWGDHEIVIGAMGDGLLRIPTSGGAEEKLTTVDIAQGEVRHYAPQFLPGDRRFLYVAASNDDGKSFLYAGSLDSKERLRIMPVESNVVFAPLSRGNERGYLLQLKGKLLIGQSFDSRTLRTSGEPFPIAEPVGSTQASGVVARVADFSAAGDAIAFRSASTGMAPVFRFQPTATVEKKDTAQVTVIRNWMSGIRR